MYLFAESALLQSLHFDQKCLNSDADLVTFLYTTAVKKYAVCGEPPQANNIVAVNKNLDVLSAVAERHFYNCDFPAAYKTASQ